MTKKRVSSLGSLLFLTVLGVLVLNKYQDIFSLNQTQSIILGVLLVVMVFSATKISEWLGKYLPWKESVLEWMSIVLLIILAAPVFIYFVL